MCIRDRCRPTFTNEVWYHLFFFRLEGTKMVRNYVRNRGSRPYKNYSEETLQKALNEIEGQKLSIRAAEK